MAHQGRVIDKVILVHIYNSDVQDHTSLTLTIISNTRIEATTSTALLTQIQLMALVTVPFLGGGVSFAYTERNEV